MSKVENINIWGYEHAIRGMRNPKNSWEHSDSVYEFDRIEDGREMYTYIIGPNDMKLMQTLFKGGTEHRKYLRQIFISMDITAPLYWWKEFDTYKVGTVSNSCSTMHKIAAKEFDLDDFSHEHLFSIRDVSNDFDIYPEEVLEACEDYGVDPDYPEEALMSVIDVLNACRLKFIETKDKRYWWQMIQLLPSSYNQRRTITMNYENVFTIIRQRRGHKLDEWNRLCDIFETFPYVKEIGGLNETD